MKSSLALRLTGYFVLLTLIPIGLFSYYLYHSLTQEYFAISTHFLLEQAEAVAARIEMSDGVSSMAGTQMSPVIDGHFVFVINSDGEYVAHSNPVKVGQNVKDDFGDDFLEEVSSRINDGGISVQYNIAYGYTSVPKQGLYVVAVGNLNDIRTPLVIFQQSTTVQLLILLMFSAISAGLVIWRVVGKPLGKLTEAAEQIGSGNLQIDINPSEMKDELRQLAVGLNTMRGQLENLIVGLQARIQELGEAQQSLQISDEQTRAIIDSINEAIFVVSMDSGEILDVNKKMTEMYGYSREELLGLRINQLNSGELPFTHKIFKKYMKDAAHAGPQLLEWKARRKDGNPFWVEINMRQAVIGGRDRILVAVREIMERKRAEQIRTALYRISHSVQAAQNLSELFYLIHGVINDLMPAQNFYIALYDHDRDEFSYPYYVDQYDTTPAPHSPNRGLTSYVLRTGSSLLASPEVFDRLLKVGEVEMIGANSFDWLGSPLNIAQRVIGVIAIQTYTANERLTDEDKDVLAFVSTQIAMAIERKRSEDALLESETRWRTLTENAPQYIMLLDRDGHVLFGNRFLPGMELQASEIHSILDFIHDENRIMIENALKDVFDEGRGVSIELSLLDADQTITWYACNLAPVVSEGRVEMAILNANDITLRKDAEKSIQSLNEELEKRVFERTTQLVSAMRELEAFSYSVSHDLRAPLRALDGYSRILEKEYQGLLDENGKSYVKNIRSSTHQMSRLIDDLLAFSRLGRHSLEKQAVDMRDLVNGSLKEFSQDLSNKGFTVTVGELPPCEGDPSLLRQLWHNLISNSIKFTGKADHPTIEIGFIPGEDVTYFIKDNGIGFDMKYADKLFEVFQRLHSVDEFEGTGVGLAIVERVARRHGGRVWSESVPGNGATFFFTLSGPPREMSTSNSGE